MIRRLAGAVLAACALFALFVADAGAEVPAGPRLTFVQSGGHGFQLVSADPSGGDQRVIAGGGDKAQPLPFPFSSLTWSADGTRVAFTGISEQEHHAFLDIYDAAADGSGLAKLPQTADGIYPVLSPGGHMLAFARVLEKEGRRPHRGEVTVFRSVSVWLLDIDSGVVRQLTPWRNGLFEYPSSFSPDGATLALSRDQSRRHGGTSIAAVALRLDGSGSTVLARHAGDPAFSPDGSRLALVTVGKPRTIRSPGGATTFAPTDLAVANADGSGLTKLTQTKNLETQPSWDPSGRRLAYTLLRAGGGEASFFGFGDSIMEVNADGSCRTKIRSDPDVALYGATWQPGPGREAGPLAC